MSNLLIGTSYAVSAGLILYAVQSKLAPAEWQFPLVLIWAVAGIGLAFAAILVARKTGAAPS